MATNGTPTAALALNDVVAAVTKMRTGDNDAKKKAHEYLEKFQKSVRPPPGVARCAHDIKWSDRL
jgi:transportin-3